MEQHDDHDYDHAATRTTKTTTTITTITKNIPPKDTAGRRGQNATCWWGSHEVPQRFPHELAGFRAAKMPSSMRRVQTHDHHAFPNDPQGTRRIQEHGQNASPHPHNYTGGIQTFRVKTRSMCWNLQWIWISRDAAARIPFESHDMSARCARESHPTEPPLVGASQEHQPVLLTLNVA